jgi:hypothetical protein
VEYNSSCNLKDNSSLYFKELKVKHLKILYKCLIGDEIDSTTLIYNLNSILNEIVNDSVFNLNFLDCFILLLEIRMSSIGNKILLQLNENTTLDVNLEQLVKILKEIDLSLLMPESFENNITIHLRLPTLLEISQFSNNEDFFYYFIEKIIIKDQVLNFEMSHEQKILNHLPAKVYAFFYKKIQKIIYHFNSINLLSYNSHIKEPILYFNFNINNLCLIIKLLFGNHLMVLYENIFALCKIGNFTPEYIENCSPGEYLLYVKKLEEFNKSRSESSELSHDLTPDMFGENVDEEPLNPYESSNLPPITSAFQG